MTHQILKSKVTELWKPSKPLVLIDLGHGFFTVKFSKEENMTKALHAGPWFVFGGFLSITQWEPNFVPSESTLTHTTIWVKFLSLPTEFYDREILEKVGNKLGMLLKIDFYTSSTLRGRYAQIRIQIPINQAVEKSSSLGNTFRRWNTKE